MNLDFQEFFDIADEDEFEEVPVDVETFVYSKEYLGFPKLSDYQMQIVRIGSQIYLEPTLQKLHGVAQGSFLWRTIKKELIMCLGKGSGKDALSTIICAYVVYQLLCLKDPAAYFGKPAGDAIDIVNVAINAKQASNVFFKGFRNRIKNCPWFAGKYKERSGDISFDKGITVHSLNSEGESTEGYNILLAVLDEIDGFDEGRETNKGESMDKTLSATVSSRFPDVGKVLKLSFPRSKDGYIMKLYNDCIAEKEVRKRRHTFVLNPELPEDYDGNTFDIEWEQDEIVAYKYANVWAIRRPTWEVNPTKTIDNFIMDFYRDPADAGGRFACNPVDYNASGFFRDKVKIDATFVLQNGWDKENDKIVVKPQHDKEYYIHVDLARLHDNCAVAMSHVESWKQIQIGNKLTEPQPFVVVDLVRYWKPTKDKPIEFPDVREFIINLRRLNFNIIKVTFDRWESYDTIKQLEAVGIPAEKLSVDRNHYNEMALVMGENRLNGPYEEVLIRELKNLITLPTGKVDHPNKETKDLSDAVCGSIFNSSTLTLSAQTNEVVTFSDIVKANRTATAEVIEDSIIRAPSKDTPAEIREFLEGIRLL